MTSRMLLMLTTFLIPAGVSAQDVTVLEPIILSAGLTPTPAEAYGRAVTVLTREDIETRGARTVQDALRAVPGVSVSGTGRNFTQVRIRGSEANHTMILVDGVDIDAGQGNVFLSGLSTANVERIEVLRGPQSVFYGASAAAGVINIITDKGTSGLRYGGAVEVGNGASASAHVSQRGAQGGLSLNLSSVDDHGFDQSGDGGEKDGIRRDSVGIAGDWRASEDLSFGSTLAWAHERYDYDQEQYPFPTPPGFGPDGFVTDDDDLTGERREFQGALWGQYSMLDGRLSHRLEYQKAIAKSRMNEGDETRGESRRLQYKLSYGLDGLAADEARHLLNLLIERKEDSSSDDAGYERARNSLALEYRAFMPSGLDVQAGVRRDANTPFDDFTSWNLGLSWQVPDSAVRLHASAGRGLVDPSYYELYVDGAFSRGNPNLKPEQNTGFDLGVEMQFPDGRGSIDVTYFNERIKDAVEAVLGSDFRYSYVNLSGESRREGLELAGRYQMTDALRFGFSYTYLDAKNPDGSVKTRRPRHEFLISGTYAFAQGNVTAEIRHVADNYDTQFWGAYEVAKLDDYTTVNLSANYDLTEQVRLTGRVVNLFDQDYSEVWGYASQNRQAYVGLQARW
jgi:vitamin B12 transporter